MTKLKKYTIPLILSVLCIILLGLLVKPSFSIVHAYTDYNNYTYDSYNVDIVVNENNSYDITETIKITYGPVSKGVHYGWARGIPYSYTVEYKDSQGRVYKYKETASITLKSVETTNVPSDTNETTRENGEFVISMRSDNMVNNKTITYIISYNFNPGYDFVNSEDYFMYNIIGSDFPVDVNNVTFSVTMPKDFDSNSLKFYTGGYGSTNTYSDYLISGNTISSSHPFNLRANEAFTINLSLPEGYFNIPSAKAYKAWNIVLPIVAGVVFVAVVVLILIFGNKDKPVSVVEFYAPDGLSPADCKYILTGKTTALDVSAVIVLWANEGYVKIVLDDKKKPKQIARIADMPECFDDDSKYIWKAIFKNSDIVDVDMSESISLAMDSVAKKVKLKYNTEGAGRYTKKSSTKFNWFVALTIVPLILFIATRMWMYSIGTGIPIGIATLLMCFLISKVCRQDGISNFKDIFNLFNVLLFLFMMLLFLVFVFTQIKGVRVADSIYFSPNIIDPSYMLVWYPILCTILYLMIGSKIFKYNKKVFDLYGRVDGFKNTLATVEADQLKALVAQDPEYFYKVIPYAHVFGIYEKFVDKFSGFAMPISENVGDPMLTVLILNDLRFNTRMHIAQHNARNARSAFGGHGGGGGGFSGGGHGGGGGRGL